MPKLDRVNMSIFNSLVTSALRVYFYFSAMDKFFNDIQKTKKKPAATAAESDEPESSEKKALPKGVVLGKDGKP